MPPTAQSVNHPRQISRGFPAISRYARSLSSMRRQHNDSSACATSFLMIDPPWFWRQCRASRTSRSCGFALDAAGPIGLSPSSFASTTRFGPTATFSARSMKTALVGRSLRRSSVPNLRTWSMRSGNCNITRSRESISTSAAQVRRFAEKARAADCCDNHRKLTG